MSQAIPYYRIGKQPKFKIADLIIFRESQRKNFGSNTSNSQGALHDESKVSLPGR
jgi:hypothetical protein